MYKSLFHLFVVSIFISFISGCAIPNQSSSFQNQLSMMSERKSVNNYKEIRAQFIEYAYSKNADKLFAMMAPYEYNKPEILDFFKNEIFPFFSEYKEVIDPEVFNIVNDEVGDPGYSMYGFIKTRDGERKPYVIAIIEKGTGFSVKNIVVNKCFKGFHPNC